MPFPNASPDHQLTRLDWSIAFNRSSIHLSNQLRGKRFSRDQLELFDTSLKQLPVDIQETARAHDIKLVGFDFTIPQQKAFGAPFRLINASGGRSPDSGDHIRSVIRLDFQLADA